MQEAYASGGTPVVLPKPNVTIVSPSTPTAPTKTAQEVANAQDVAVALPGGTVKTATGATQYGYTLFGTTYPLPDWFCKLVDEINKLKGQPPMKGMGGSIGDL